MKHFAIVITEIHDEDPPGKFWGPLRVKYHREEEIFKSILRQEQFDFRLILAAILRGVKNGNEL